MQMWLLKSISAIYLRVKGMFGIENGNGRERELLKRGKGKVMCYLYWLIGKYDPV